MAVAIRSSRAASTTLRSGRPCGRRSERVQTARDGLNRRRQVVEIERRPASIVQSEQEVVATRFAVDEEDRMKLFDARSTVSSETLAAWR